MNILARQHLQNITRLYLKSPNYLSNVVVRTSVSSSNDRGVLVYENGSKKYVMMVKGFSLFTSTLFLSVQPFLISQMSLNGPMSYVICGGISSLALATPFLLHYLTRAFVTHIYYNQSSDLYTAITKSLFLRDKFIVYSSKDAKLPDLTSPLATLLVKDKPLLIYLDHFKNPSAYFKMLQFDANSVPKP